MFNPEHRTLKSIIIGIWIRFWSIVAQFTFPAQITTMVHRLRGVHIGRGSKVARSVLIDDSKPNLVTIGRDVWVTAGCQLLCHQRDLKYYHKDMPVKACPLKYAPINIKDGAHIGIGSIIMPGVTIGRGAVIGAGSVVTKDVPDYSLALGVPARIVKTLGE